MPGERGLGEGFRHLNRFLPPQMNDAEVIEMIREQEGDEAPTILEKVHLAQSGLSQPPNFLIARHHHRTASRLLQKVPSGGRAMLLVWKTRQNQELFLTIKKE